MLLKRHYCLNSLKQYTCLVLFNGTFFLYCFKMQCICFILLLVDKTSSNYRPCLRFPLAQFTFPFKSDIFVQLFVLICLIYYCLISWNLVCFITGHLLTYYFYSILHLSLKIDFNHSKTSIHFTSKYGMIPFMKGEILKENKQNNLQT